MALIALPDLLVLMALGAFLTMEATAVGQFMLSRPVVAATVAGWLLGSTGQGFTIGALLELYLLVSFPVGGARFPEGGLAAVVAAAVAIPLSAGSLAIGVSVGLVWGQLGGISTTTMRGLHGRIVPAAGLERLTPGRVAAAHGAALLVDLLRGLVLAGTGILAGRWAVSTFAPSWPLDPAGTRGLLLLGALVSLGILVHSLGGARRRRRLVVAGAALGGALGWLL